MLIVCLLLDRIYLEGRKQSSYVWRGTDGRTFVEVCFWERSIFLHDRWVRELPEKNSERRGINIEEKEKARNTLVSMIHWHSVPHKLIQGELCLMGI